MAPQIPDSTRPTAETGITTGAGAQSKLNPIVQKFKDMLEKTGPKDLPQEIDKFLNELKGNKDINYEKALKRIRAWLEKQPESPKINLAKCKVIGEQLALLEKKVKNPEAQQSGYSPLPAPTDQDGKMQEHFSKIQKDSNNFMGSAKIQINDNMYAMATGRQVNSGQDNYGQYKDFKVTYKYMSGSSSTGYVNTQYGSNPYAAINQTSTQDAGQETRTFRLYTDGHNKNRVVLLKEKE